MRERRILIELVCRPDGTYSAKATDYRLGAVRFHEVSGTGLSPMFSSLRKAVVRLLKEK